MVTKFKMYKNSYSEKICILHKNKKIWRKFSIIDQYFDVFLDWKQTNSKILIKFLLKLKCLAK